jgi:hypothetical protein
MIAQAAGRLEFGDVSLGCGALLYDCLLSARRKRWFFGAPARAFYDTYHGIVRLPSSLPFADLVTRQ